MKNKILAAVILVLALVFSGCSGVRVLDTPTPPETTGEPVVPAVAIVPEYGQEEHEYEENGQEVHEYYEDELEEYAENYEEYVTEEHGMAEYGNEGYVPQEGEPPLSDPTVIIGPRERDPHEKLIALTFDDGPGRHTQRILDTLAEHGGYATFFVLGERVWNRRQIILNMIAQGSEPAGHSWHHHDLTRLSEQEIIDQIAYTDRAISNVTGQPTPPFFRAPFGHFDRVVLRASRDLGVALIQWSLNPQDYLNRSADMIYEHIMANARNGDIVLLHDIHETTADAMERVIPGLIGQGFRLVTVSYLLGETVPGRTYTSEFRSIEWLD